MVVKASTRGARFGTFAAHFGLADQSVHVDNDGHDGERTEAEEQSDAGLAPPPATGAQTEAVANAPTATGSSWRTSATITPSPSASMRAFRSTLRRQSDAARGARQDAEILFQLLNNPDADSVEQARDLAGQLAAFVHPRAQRRFSRD